MNYNRLLFNVKNRIVDPSILTWFNEAMTNQMLSKDELKALNLEKRKRIVAFAYENVPFYKGLYDKQNVHPNDIKSDEDWDMLPMITKADLRSNADLFIAKGVSKKRLQPSTTGGSTGVPLKVFHDKNFPNRVLGWRMLSWFNISPECNIAFIFRNRHETSIKKLINKALWWPTKRAFLDASSITEVDILAFIKTINVIKPLVIQGYVGAVVKVARYIIDNNIDCHSPKICWVTSSPISSIEKSLLSEAFKCEIVDQYGCGEIFWIAAESHEHDCLHVFDDFRHIDIVNSSDLKRTKLNEIGDIVLTDLENYAFPIIKYRNGDQSMLLDNASSDFPFSKIAPIKGRISDSIILPDGKFISGDYLTTIFDDYTDLVSAFQVVQKKDYSITIKYVPRPNTANELMTALEVVERRLIKKTGNTATFLFQEETKIPDDRGKIKFIISELKQIANESRN